MTNRNTKRKCIKKKKIAISLEDSLLQQVDELVEKRIFPNRSKAIQEAILDKLTRINKSRLAVECAKLDPDFEKAIAEEGMSTEMDEWPEY